MLGKGLSSLIPKKNEEERSSSKNAVVSPQQGETQPASQSRSSDTPIFSQVIFPPREKVSNRKVSAGDSIFQIEVEKIKPNPCQPRRDFKEEELKDLADSIRAHGILQPLVISKIEKETESGTEVEYQLIVGERRLMAAKIIGLERVPAIIKKIDDRRVKLEMALIENIQRSNLSPIEAARAYTRLYEEFGLTQQEIGTRVGKSRESIANTLRLLKLPPSIQEALDRGQINESQARTLLAIVNPQEQEKAFVALLSQKLTVRELQERTIKQKITDPQLVYWEKQLEEKIGSPVRVIKNGSKGKIIIQFFSEGEWRNILEKLIGSEF
jgi:ParB family chromosome partitioning protein